MSILSFWWCFIFINGQFLIKLKLSKNKLHRILSINKRNFIKIVSSHLQVEWVILNHFRISFLVNWIMNLVRIESNYFIFFNKSDYESSQVRINPIMILSSRLQSVCSMLEGGGRNVKDVTANVNFRFALLFLV